MEDTIYPQGLRDPRKFKEFIRLSEARSLEKSFKTRDKDFFFDTEYSMHIPLMSQKNVTIQMSSYLHIYNFLFKNTFLCVIKVFNKWLYKKNMLLFCSIRELYSLS